MESHKKGEEAKPNDCLCWTLVLVLVGLVASASVLTLLSYFKHSKSKAGGVPDRPGPVVAQYAHALDIAMRFFDVQKCIESLPLLLIQRTNSVVELCYGLKYFYCLFRTP